MKFFITFKIQNQEFDSKYAKEYHFGKESDGNRKDLWSSGFKLGDKILEYKETKDCSFELKQKWEDNTLEIFQIADVTIVECLTDMNDRIEIVVSNKLISKTHVAHNPKYDTTRYYFYLNHNVEYCKLSDFIYLTKKDLPSELLISNE